MKEAKRSKITEQMCRQAQLFDWKAYVENGKIRREREKNLQKEPETETNEQVPGQIEMDLTTEGKTEMSEQTKLMRFQAAQVDKVIMKLDQIYNVANMILRAIRKE